MRQLRSLLAGISVLIAGCSNLGAPGQHPVQHIDVESLTWSSPENATETSYLNELVADSRIDDLVKTALGNNAGLQQSLMSLKIIQQQYYQISGESLPTVDAYLTDVKAKNTTREYSGGINVSWVVDLWGKVSDQSHAAAKTYQQQQNLYQQTQDTIAAETMQSWLRLIHLQQQIVISDHRIDVLEKNEQLIYQRYRSGLGTLEDLDSSRATTASARSAQEIRLESLAQQQRVLNVLLGRMQGQTVIPDDYPVVLTSLADLPQQTLSRRPDLKAAWSDVEAKSYNVQVAYKDMLPSISLQASFAGSAETPSQVLFENPVWTLLGQLSAPVFRGGELKAALEISRLEQAQAFYSYRQTLLNAVEEVEDTLGQEKSLTRQIEHVQKALQSAQSNLSQYQQRYRSGLVSMLDLLSVQQQTFDLQSQLDGLVYERLSNRVTLGLALGLGVKNDT